MDNVKPHYSIAIDGTAASGKSTVAQLLAERLGCGYLDTGKLYRAVALDFLTELRSAPDTWADSANLGPRLQSMAVRVVTPDSGECRIHLGAEDVNERLAELTVEQATPFAARIPAVRDYLLDVQRDLARDASVVMAGRDIGTVVLPNATLKVFIVADLEERARRRLSQHKQDFTESELREAAAALGSRDKQDSSRKCAPMACADDALKLDSTNMTPEELVNTICQALQERLAARS